MQEDLPKSVAFAYSAAGRIEHLNLGLVDLLELAAPDRPDVRATLRRWLREGPLPPLDVVDGLARISPEEILGLVALAAAVVAGFADAGSALSVFRAAVHGSRQVFGGAPDAVLTWACVDARPRVTVGKSGQVLDAVEAAADDGFWCYLGRGVRVLEAAVARVLKEKTGCF